MNKAIISLCTLSLLTACAGPAIKDTVLIQQTAINQAQTEKQDPQQVIETSRELQINAQQQDLYFYSPNYMAQAEKEMAKAEDALKQSKPASVIITHSLMAKALFERGLATKETVINQLKLSFDGLVMLKEINAHVLLKDDFADIEDDIKDLIILIEQDKTQRALKEQKDVLADIIELEVDTLLAGHFSPAEKALEKAEDADADEFAAKTFEIAEQAIEKLEIFIETRYKERETIREHSEAAIRLAQHAENVAKAAQPLLKMNSEQAEEHVLYVESLLDRVTKALEHSSITHLPLNNQSIALAQAVETLSKQAQTNQKNKQWSEEKQALEATIAKLQKASEKNKEDSPILTEAPENKPDEEAQENLTKTETSPEETLNKTDNKLVEPAQENAEAVKPLPTANIDADESNQIVTSEQTASDNTEVSTVESLPTETPNASTTPVETPSAEELTEKDTNTQP